MNNSRADIPGIISPSYTIITHGNILTSCRGAMGMAGIGIALWKYAMKYSPSNPNYFNRDRFVLSNGWSLFPVDVKLVADRCVRTHLSLPVYLYAFGWIQ